MVQNNNSKSRKINHYRKNSYRLNGYDYSSTGAYFVTICSVNRIKIFGGYSKGKVSYNRYGLIVIDEWFRSAKIRKNVISFSDEFVLMPDHLHGIVWIIDSECDEYKNLDPLHRTHDKNRSIGNIIGQFKASTTRRINKIRNTPGNKIWQWNYFDRIIRNESELERIRKYVQQNPSKENCDLDLFFDWINEEI